MAVEVINKERIQDFPFDTLIFTPATKTGKVYEGFDQIHYKDGRFLTYPFDEELNNKHIYDYYIIEYK